MDVDAWVADQDAVYRVERDDAGPVYVAVVYGEADATADVVPAPVFRAFTQPGLQDTGRLDSRAMRDAADGHGYGDAVDTWVDAGVLPPYRSEVCWETAQRYAGYGLQDLSEG